jgi:hypothetical protein
MAKLRPLENTVDNIGNDVSCIKIRESMLASKLQTKVNEFRQELNFRIIKDENLTKRIETLEGFNMTSLRAELKAMD